MQIDLAYGDMSHSVIRCANINTSLVPVHFLNYIRWGHVLILACKWWQQQHVGYVVIWKREEKEANEERDQDDDG